jgi:hypothetical protein
MVYCLDSISICISSVEEVSSSPICMFKSKPHPGSLDKVVESDPFALDGNYCIGRSSASGKTQLDD